MVAVGDSPSINDTSPSSVDETTVCKSPRSSDVVGVWRNEIEIGELTDGVAVRRPVGLVCITAADAVMRLSEISVISRSKVVRTSIMVVSSS